MSGESERKEKKAKRTEREHLLSTGPMILAIGLPMGWWDPHPKLGDPSTRLWAHPEPKD